MKINKSYSIVTLIAVSIFVSLGVQAAPRSTPVTIVNDATTPVPVAGTVDVNITGTPGITIQNSESNPVPVSSKTFGRTPFKLTGNFSFGTGVFADVTMNPPADKIAVIEMVTASFVLDNDDPVRTVSLLTAPGGTGLTGFILQPPQITSALATANDHLVSQQVRLYSAPGWPVIFRVERNSTSLDNRLGVVRISGYLVPVDSPSLSP